MEAVPTPAQKKKRDGIMAERGRPDHRMERRNALKAILAFNFRWRCCASKTGALRRRLDRASAKPNHLKNLALTLAPG